MATHAESQSDIDDLARAVLDAACARALTLATAESGTGGLLASVLTDFPGRSHVFERGFVVSSDAAKIEMLNLPAGLLERGGAVSQPAAIALAEGAIQRSRADVAVSITGWTEAGDDVERPVGLIHFACARRGGYTHHRKADFGDIGRAALRLACVTIALRMLHQAVAD